MPNRPAIPADIARDVLIESGHRCAVCGTPCPLEKAHIIPWRETHEHTRENLICLCANCHGRADNENWGAGALREYKQRPWVTRAFENYIPDKRTARVQLIIDAELSDFTDRDARMLPLALAALLDIPPQAITIISVEAGSVKIVLELPEDSVRKLWSMYKYEPDALYSSFIFRPEPSPLVQSLEPLALCDIRLLLSREQKSQIARQWYEDGGRDNLEGFDLSQADLRSVRLPHAKLAVADLSGADLTGADLTGANLAYANLSQTHMAEINLSGADVTSTDVREADLRGANLSGADLIGADLRRANLRRANLSGADLYWADLREADLRGADLRGARVWRANLWGANVMQVHRGKAKLLIVALVNSVFVTLPEKLMRPGDVAMGDVSGGMEDSPIADDDITTSSSRSADAQPLSPQPQLADGYDFAAIRQLLLSAFTPTTLRRFCLDRAIFRPLVNEFSPGLGLNDMVDRVIEYCSTQLLLGQLLAEIRQENHSQYERFEPYRS